MNKNITQLIHSNLKEINSYIFSLEFILFIHYQNFLQVILLLCLKIIYINNFNIIQNILNAYDNSILDIDIKDDKNFVT
jgi:hypothetical protein